MKKNKLLYLALALTLVIATFGCTAQPRNPGGTQTRIGLDSPNNNMINRNIRDDDNGLMDMDNNINERNGRIGRNTIIDDDNNGLTNNNANNGLTNNNGNNGVGNNDEDAAERADRIADRIAALEEVNRASVLISGDTAIVGINMKNNIQGQMTRNLKQRIETTVRNADNDIDNVSITADPDLFTRISNMANEIGNGRPISGFAEQFEEILRRINPVR